MPEAEGENPDDPPPPPRQSPPRPQPPPSPPTTIGRELMDLDLDFDAVWPFDPASFLSDSPPGFLLCSSSSSSPVITPLQRPPQPAAPPSPLCLFDERATELPDAPPESFDFISGVPDTADIGLDDNKKPTPLLVPLATNASDTSYLVKEKLTRALRQFKESTDQHVLAQVWAPVKNGDRYVLTTSGQPFVLDPHSTSLFQYRTVSSMYLFSAAGDSDTYLGLPGRVFCKKIPEWTPDVQYYSSREYPRLTHALNHNVRGTLALPVFEPPCQACVGVVELIMTSPKINYAHEVDKVCKALEAVNLKSSEILEHPSVQMCSESRQAALAEILEILSVVCETHKLPLAQTWVPCGHGSVLADDGGSKKSYSSFDWSCGGQVCMSTTDAAFYVIDPRIWGFRDACAEHHLQKGQGVAGMAFSLRRPCFSSDVTKFFKTQYPLVHYARMFGLVSCLAICLQSYHTRNDDYILEFFLPTDAKNEAKQQLLLQTILTTIRQCLCSLNVLVMSDMQDEMLDEIFHVTPNANEDFESTDIHNKSPKGHGSASTGVVGPLACTQQANKLSFHNLFDESVLSKPIDENGDAKKQEPCNVISLSSAKNSKKHERRRGKAEKSISLQVLQQYFTGSLKDAAKSLGVCPTTMKRICRQHGISRWPSRKINKVNRSLSKLQRVIESVQGADRAFNLSSLTSCPLPISVGSRGRPSSLDDTHPKEVSEKCVDSLMKKENGSLAQKSSTDEQDGGPCSQLALDNQSHFKPKLCKDSHGLHTSYSGEESTSRPASQGSCQDIPVSGSNREILNISHLSKQAVNTKESFLVTFQIAESAEPSPDLQRCDANDTAVDLPLGGMLIEGTGSSKDLKNLSPTSGNAFRDEQMLLPANGPSRHASTQDVSTVTIKASYKEDIIRFRLHCDAGILVLEEEISRRLKLDVGTFDIRYLDDDGEWVLLACEADLEECLDLSRLSGGHLIRLSVHDIAVNLGSSCESTGLINPA